MTSHWSQGEWRLVHSPEIQDKLSDEHATTAGAQNSVKSFDIR